MLGVQTCTCVVFRPPPCMHVAPLARSQNVSQEPFTWLNQHNEQYLYNETARKYIIIIRNSITHKVCKSYGQSSLHTCTSHSNLSAFIYYMYALDNLTSYQCTSCHWSLPEHSFQMMPVERGQSAEKTCSQWKRVSSVIR